MSIVKAMYRTGDILARTIYASLETGSFRKGNSGIFTQIVDSHLVGDKLPRTDGFVTNALFSSQNLVEPLALTNPLGGVDHDLATWFHERLTPVFVTVLHAFTDFGSGTLIGVIMFGLVSFFAWKRWWPSLITVIVAVPGGMLLNEWVKVLVHRQRPFVDGPFVDWSGYSFASGHTIGATLLYGQLLLFVLPALKARHWRLLSIMSAISLVALVGFSRIALGAHFLTDVLAAILFGAIWLALCVALGRPMRRNSSRSESTDSFPGENGPVFIPVKGVTPQDLIPR